MAGEADGSVTAVTVARAAGAEAGTAPADSVVMGCDLIRIGVFFDGTGNSRDHANTGDISWHTNVDLLERLYIDNGAPQVQRVQGTRREVRTFSRYARGIGVESDGGTTTRGMAWGTGSEGVEQRVADTIDDLLEDIRRNASGMQPCDIWFDAFGFSRGATAARDFANGVKDGEIRYGSSRMRVKFMGLFDTVSSVGHAGNTRNYGNVSLNTRNVADKIAHITAEDEIREYFPLTRAFGETWVRVAGAHSDIGGGYAPGRRTTTFTYDPADYPGVLSSYRQRWGIGDSRMAVPDNDRTRTTTTPGRFYGENTETVITTTSEHGIQFVTLRLMFDMAKAESVPFPSQLPSAIEGISIRIASDLNAYYQELSAGLQGPVRNTGVRGNRQTEMAIRRRYAHFSVNNDSNWGIQPNVPQPSGWRIMDFL
jgi:hypothetical protein